MRGLKEPNSRPDRYPGEGFAKTVNQVSEFVKSIDLLKGRRAIDIEHNGCLYRLQTTKLGKLILTK